MDEETIHLDIQGAVMVAVMTMYDRFCQVNFANNKPACSFEDFFNQLVVRGMCEYNPQLCGIEEDMNKLAEMNRKTEGDKIGAGTK